MMMWLFSRRWVLLSGVAVIIACFVVLQDKKIKRLKGTLAAAQVTARHYEDAARANQAVIEAMQRQQQQDRAAIAALTQKQAATRREYRKIIERIPDGQTPAIDGLVAVRDSVRQRLQARENLPAIAAPGAGD
jgi:predicted Holliday junction resolvase-like endonuclease